MFDEPRKMSMNASLTLRYLDSRMREAKIASTNSIRVRRDLEFVPSLFSGFMTAPFYSQLTKEQYKSNARLSGCYVKAYVWFIKRLCQSGDGFPSGMLLCAIGIIFRVRMDKSSRVIRRSTAIAAEMLDCSAICQPQFVCHQLIEAEP